MLDYWKKHPATTFAFYAVPRKWKETFLNEKKRTPKEAQKFIDRYKNVRFSVYRYAMVNLFPPTHFIQLRDAKNNIYVLLNKKQKKPKTTIKLLGKYLAANYEMIFDPEEQ